MPAPGRVYIEATLDGGSVNVKTCASLPPMDRARVIGIVTLIACNMFYDLARQTGLAREHNPESLAAFFARQVRQGLPLVAECRENGYAQEHGDAQETGEEDE